MSSRPRAPKKAEGGCPQALYWPETQGRCQGTKAGPMRLISSARCLVELSVRGLDSRAFKKKNKKPPHGNQGRGERGSLHFSASCLFPGGSLTHPRKGRVI